MNNYINELLKLLSVETKTDGISEFEITIVDDVLKIRRCKIEMFYALLDFLKKFKLRAELYDGVLSIYCKESEERNNG